MIHFQYSESGATLRASDVKPRFDKFLIRQMTEEQREKFAISEEHALDYKMQIAAGGEPVISDIIAGSYFGNMNGDAPHKKTVFYRDPVSLKIICFHQELRDLIDNHIRGFFLLHNFGTRQDKGFGAFRIIENSLSAETLLQRYAEDEQYIAFTIDDSRCRYWDRNKNTWKKKAPDHLDNADIFYKLLKSGINCSNAPARITPRPETYVKSFLTTYMLTKNIGGEKRWMKRDGIGPAIGKSSLNNTDYQNITEFKYIRALLGTGEWQKWLTRIGGSNTTEIHISPVSGNPIERFQSPLTFTVYDKQLYVIAYDPDSVIYDKEFKFSGMTEGICRTPTHQDFDMRDFMRYVRTNLAGRRIQYYDGGIYRFDMTEVAAFK